ALNLDAVSALCLPLSAAKIAGWQKAMFEWSYARSGDEEGSADPYQTPWQLMAAQPRVTSLPTQAAANRARTLPLDLGALCAQQAGQPGVYALELQPRAAALQTLGRQGDEPARAIANVTDLAVVAKRGASHALVWVT